MNPRNYRLPILLLVGALLLSVVPVVTADDSYTVQPGDTLYRIARRYGLTVDELAAANEIGDPHRLYAGQVLVIPAEVEGVAAAEVVTAPEIETDGKLSFLEAAAGNRANRILDAVATTTATVDALVAQQTEIRESMTAEHVVQAGETLARIGRRYGVTTAALVRANQLASPDVIYPGQRLHIPLTAAGGMEANAPPPAAGGYKQIIVDKSEQRAYVYQGGELLWTFIVSTGMPDSETWEGTFRVRSKIPNAYAYNWNLQMPYWLGFYHTGYLENGFHALPIMANGAILWDGYLGTPVSYGCVILSYPDAETLYQWAEIGTEVVVRQ